MENKNYVLITGGTSGIGLELSKLFAKDGYSLIIVARNENDLSKTANDLQQEYGVDVVTISKDLFYLGNAFELYDEVKSKSLQVDILVNDAGQGLYGEFVDNDIQREIDIINLNISSLVVLTKQFVKDMVQRGSGKVLNLASVASKIPGPWQAVYHGTKAFVLSFSEAIRVELKDTNVTVTALMPGATDTDFFNKAGMKNAKNVVDGKLDSAEDVAKDGYKALMNNDDKVVSGFKNKVQVSMSNLTPDETVARQVYKQQEPADKDEK